jgi:pimeloyl-ACP methyl ester carboxylesterase
MWLTTKYLQPTFVTFFAVTPELKAGLSPQDNAWVSNVVIPSLLPISEREPGISHHTTDFARINYPLEQIRVPTLIIDAKDDLGPPANAMFSTSPSHSAYAAEKTPNAVHIEYATGGHLLFGHEREAKAAIMKFIGQYQ